MEQIFFFKVVSYKGKLSIITVCVIASSQTLMCLASYATGWATCLWIYLVNYPNGIYKTNNTFTSNIFQLYSPIDNNIYR